MIRKKLTYYFLTIKAIFAMAGAHAQLGAPIINQDFGLGNVDPGTIGAALPAGSTGFTFENSLCPAPGNYTIVRRINVNGCFDNEWIPLSSDYTSDHAFGMDLSNMMLVNNSESDQPRLVYQQATDQQLCPGSVYRFQVAVINVDTPKTCLPINAFPHFAMVVEDGNGQLIASDTIRGIPYASPFPKYTFAAMRVDFTMPAGVTRLVCKLVLLRSFVSNSCGDDFAIDDFALYPFGPAVDIQFDDNPTHTVRSVCFQHNSTISMSGVMNPYYTSPSLQWQQSTDWGTTWTDIPGATNAVYTQAFSVPDTILFRLSGGDASNIANPNCRVVSNTIRVEVDGIPVDFNATNNSPICAGQDLQFDVAGSGARYIWTGPNGFSDNIQFPHIFDVSVADSGMYYVDLFTQGGCTARDSTYAVIIGIDVDAGPDTAICKGQTVQLFASPGLSHVWTPAEGLSSANAVNPAAKPHTTTTYIVQVKDVSGCTDTAKVTVKLINQAEVVAMIEGNEIVCRSYDSAYFHDVSPGNSATRYWDFGNGQSSSLSEPPVQYYSIAANTTAYVIRLAVSDSLGCTDTAYHTLKVAENCFIAVATAFTPNGDGLNDYLYPLNAYKATDLLFRVFDRSGRIVFETRNWSRKWDGSRGGIPQASGVYVWTLDYLDASRKRIFQKGTTVLIR